MTDETHLESSSLSPTKPGVYRTCQTKQAECGRLHVLLCLAGPGGWSWAQMHCVRGPTCCQWCWSLQQPLLPGHRLPTPTQCPPCRCVRVTHGLQTSQSCPHGLMVSVTLLHTSGCNHAATSGRGFLGHLHACPLSSSCISALAVPPSHCTTSSHLTCTQVKRWRERGCFC